MNKLNLKKTLAAGIFAATIITITACGGSGGSSSAGTAPASTKITTIAGGGDSTTSTDPAQATLGLVFNLVARDGSLLFNSDRDGTAKQQVLDLATNQLKLPAAYSGLGSGERPSSLLVASADKYYFWVYKSFASSVAYALYDATSGLASNHIAGKNDAVSTAFATNDKGKLASFTKPSYQAVLYKDGTAEQLFFTDSDKIRKVTLSGDYPVNNVNASSRYNAGIIALSGDKLIVTAPSSSIIFEYDLKNNTGDKVIAGSTSGYENAENPLQAKLKYPKYIVTSPAGNIYFTVHGVAYDNQRIIRKLAVSNGVYGAVTTAFGAAPDSTADNAELNNIYDLEFVGNNLYVIDTDDNLRDRIKKIEFINQTP